MGLKGKGLSTNGEIAEGFLKTDSGINIFGSESVFEVMALTGYKKQSGEESSFMGRILDDRMAHVTFLPDPCSEAMAVDSAANSRIISLHSKIIVKESQNDIVVSPGTIVEARCVAGDIGMSFDLQNLFFVKILEDRAADEGEEACKSILEALADWDGDTLSSIVISPNPPNVTENALKFIEDMKDSGYFNGFCDTFLAAAAANAQHESAFDSSANGDPRGSVRVGNTAHAINVGGTNYCSFGYWQLNVCSGEGQSFAERFNLSLEDNEQSRQNLYDAITDPQKQFQYVSEKWLAMFGTDIRSSEGKCQTAEYWAEEIAVKFEICTKCKRATGSPPRTDNEETRARMEHAKQNYDEL